MNLARAFTFIALAVSAGCDNINGIPVDYGPSVSSEEVVKAIRSGITGSDPSSTPAGAAVQYTTIQYLAGGQVSTLTGVTTLAVTKREETAGSVTLTVIELKQPVSEKPGERVQKSTREFRLVFNSASAYYAVEGATAPLALSPPAAATASVPTTYHKLSFHTSNGAPPKSVMDTPGCRGVPACSMKYHSISFDQVAWRAEGPEKIHFDFVVSPDVPQISGFNMSPLFPYYQGLMKSCVTMLVKAGDGHEKTLLTECQQVQDFLYNAR